MKRLPLLCRLRGHGWRKCTKVLGGLVRRSCPRCVDLDGPTRPTAPAPRTSIRILTDVADPSAPTLDELNGGIDLSCHLLGPIQFVNPTTLEEPNR